MSLKNFMSYVDAETVLTDFANAIKSKDAAYMTITYSDWIAMTDAQKEAGKYYITDVPGADGTIQIDLMTLLWENPNPTSAFVAQDITLSSDDYDYLMINWNRTNSLALVKDGNFTNVVAKGANGYLCCSYSSNSGVRTMSRNFYYNTGSTTSLHFYDGYYSVAGGASQTKDNNNVIPYKIYGIKLHHEIEVSASLFASQTHTFTIASTDWVTNTGSDATAFPYVANISTELYPNTFIPCETLLLGADATDYPTSADETAISLVDKYIKFTGTAIRLRATDAPATSLTLMVRG